MQQAGFRQPSRIQTYWTIAILMVFGLLLRITWMGIVPFQIDEAALSIFASQIVNFQHFPLVGIKTSFGFHNPPFLIYAAAPAFALTPDPRYASYFLAFLGTAAVGLSGLASRRLWGGWAAVITAVIVCFSPTAIEHSRRLWGHDTIIFFSALSVYCSIRGFQNQRRRWFIFALASAAAAQACHLSGVLLWIVPVGALCYFRPRYWKRLLAVGAAILFLLYLPWILYDAGIGRESEAPAFNEARLILSLATGRADTPPAQSPAPAIVSWLRLFTDGSSQEILHNDPSEFNEVFGGLHLLFLAIKYIFAAVIVAGAISGLLFFAGNRKTNRRKAGWAGLLSVSALAPALIFTILPLTTVPPYQLPAFVPAAILSGGLLALLAGARKINDNNDHFDLLIPWRWFVLVAMLAGFFVLAGATWIIGARVFVSKAKPDSMVNSVFDFKYDTMGYIVGAGTESTYAIMQDGRSVEAGVDFWILYMHYYLSGVDEVPTNRFVQDVFVIVDDKTVLRPELNAYLKPRHFTQVGTLRTYRLIGDEAEEWRLLTRKFPSVREGHPAESDQ